MDNVAANEGLRHRGWRQVGEQPPEFRQLPPAPQPPARSEHRGRAAQTWKISRLYCTLAALLAVLAVITAPADSRVWSSPSITASPPEVVRAPTLVNLDWAWWLPTLFAEDNKKVLSKSPDSISTYTAPKLPPWLRWLTPPDSVLSQDPPSTQSLIDPSLLNPSPTTLTDLLDKILTSTPRLLAIANLLLALTYLLHTAVAEWFLQPDWNTRDRLGGFLVFKLLLISAVVAPDTLDLLILLSWYTLLSFLRSLAHLCDGTTLHTAQSGQPPRPGVLKLLALVLLSDILAASVCVALFHGAGRDMVLLLTCDCALLGLDVLSHILRHGAQVLEVQHGDAVSRIEREQLRLHARNEDGSQAPVEPNEGRDMDAVVERSRRLDRRMEILEQHHNRRLSILDTTVFGLQLMTYAITVGHFVHIWSLHGLQFTLIDGVLAMHLHSALSSASRKVAERRNLNRIARDLDCLFEDASDLDLRKATAAGDVCCICLGTMSTGNAKKVGCGHLYHTNCLREVVERARSMEAARCPLCRASVVDGQQHASSAAPGGPVVVARDGGDPIRPGEEPTPNPQEEANNAPPANNANNGGGGEGHALFRFSTEGILPAWIPVPAFSFEVVRRPPVAQENLPDPARNNPARPDDGVPEPRQSLLRRLLILTGAIPMSPEEEAAALDQLVDMFPQYDRGDLLRELRLRGSSEGVAESILMGLFTGIPRGPAN